MHHNQRLTSHRHEPEEPVLQVYGGAASDLRQLHRFGLLILLALMFIPSGYIVTGISKAKGMNVLQIMPVFVVEAVRIFLGSKMFRL
jgi:hypothetical protein